MQLRQRAEHLGPAPSSLLSAATASSVAPSTPSSRSPLLPTLVPVSVPVVAVLHLLLQLMLQPRRKRRKWNQRQKNLMRTWASACSARNHTSTLKLKINE